MSLNKIEKGQLTLNDKVLLASLFLSAGDIKNFTAEDILIKAWKDDKSAFGLRGHENDFPDSNKLYTKLDGKGGLVSKGLLKKVSDRTYILTEAGLASALDLKPSKEEEQIKLDRRLQESVAKIINHTVFQEWLKDPNKPKQFRDAGWFWGIAPGTPPKIVKERLTAVENTLVIAKNRLNKLGVSQIVEQRGKKLFDRKDIELCLEFINTLKARFKHDLEILLEERI
jgi:hypothetical protein